MSFIIAERLSKSYGHGPTAVTALRDASFTVPAGQRLAILGKSGSGKSTLLNLLGGLDQPTTGQLTVAGQSLGTLSRRQLAEYRRRRIGFVFQSFHLIPSSSVLQNVELPLMLAGMKPGERRRQALAALDAVGMAPRVTHRPAELSGGERQRTAMARAIVHRPELLLADEPTGNLDSQTAGTVMTLIVDQVKTRGMTLILVTHDEELASRTTDRVLRMADGRIVNEHSFALEVAGKDGTVK
jgi:ABC-type lipoprotein export system ATPase subunit